MAGVVPEEICPLSGVSRSKDSLLLRNPKKSSERLLLFTRATRGDSGAQVRLDSPVLNVGLRSACKAHLDYHNILHYSSVDSLGSSVRSRVLPRSCAKARRADNRSPHGLSL